MSRPLPAHVVADTGGDVDSIRNLILDAAHRVVADQGLTGASTRAIAAEAGLGAGTLYNYFDDRLSLVAQSMLRRADVLSEPLGDLASRAGRYTVATNLRYAMRHAAEVMDEMVPLIAAAFSDPDLLTVFRNEMGSHGSSFDPASPVESYLLAERDLGRIATDADCRAAASVLVSICHDHAFHRFLRGQGSGAGLPDKEIDLVVRGLTEL